MKNIKSILKSEGIEFKWFMSQVGISYPMIDRYDAGDASPSLENAIKILDLINEKSSERVYTFKDFA